MSQLSKLMDVDAKVFEFGARLLEKSSGQKGIDARLVADIYAEAHKVMRSLNLDPADTTGRELYHTLMSTVETGKAETMLLECDYALLDFNGQIVSFNLIDVVENFHHQLSYAKQTFVHGRRSLRGEFIGRYLHSSQTHDETVKEIASMMGIDSVAVIK